jgi:pimeloyl-ACP methyl ester carboxylesterase
MNTVHSKDGTPIAYDRVGQGPNLILVTGAFVTRSDSASLAASLSPYFSVFTYDRRGRGESGDTAPYAIEREVEDIQALTGAAGGSTFLFGHSSGAVLALKAARRFPARVQKLAVYEPPFIVDDSRPPVPDDFAAHLSELAAAGRRSEAVAYFMTTAMEIPAEGLAYMQNAPMWPGLEAAAHTLAYDGAIMGDTMRGRALSNDPWASIQIPVLVMDGEKSPVFMHNGTQALTNILPHAQQRRFPGQDHGIADEVLTPVLVEFFTGK